MHNKDLIEYWQRRIERDLASFGDPGGEVEVAAEGKTLNALWVMHGSLKEKKFFVSSSNAVSVEIDNRNVPYTEFLAGPDMADLRQVAQMIGQASGNPLFVETEAEYGGLRTSAVTALADLVKREDQTATRVIMVTGGAGAGKTRVLKEFVRRQANDYIHGRTSILALYVNAQGRALARLNEALATELQDLRVGLTYHSVAVLSRYGILVPVIDGFDELLGINGYDDAFGSLAGFLEQLEGSGQLLASARSVYYEEEFLSRASEMAASGESRWSHVSVPVSEWSDGDRESYITKWAENKNLSDSELRNLRARVETTFGSENRDLSQKPLFFTQVVDMLHDDPLFSGGVDLLRALVSHYLERERKEKLLDRGGKCLLTEDQLERLISELAEEMWNQETRELNAQSVREVAEYFVENESLPEDAKRVIAEKMPALAFLSHGEGLRVNRGISFEHEMFFFYFLAVAVVSKLESPDADARRILSRSALSEDTADRIADGLGKRELAGNHERLRGLIERLSDAGATEWRRTTQVRENAGLIVMSLLRGNADGSDETEEIEECVIRSVIFPGSHLKNLILKRCTLTDVTINRTDLTRTRFIDCDAQNVLLVEPHLNFDHTRLELNGMGVEQVRGVRVVYGDGIRESYDPTFIAETLVKCGARVEFERGENGPQVSEEYRALVGRLIHAYRRANPVCVEDDNLKGIFRNARWNRLEKLLLKHDILTEETRPTGGKQKKFLRRQFLPGQIMSGLSERSAADLRIRRFWEELAQK